MKLQFRREDRSKFIALSVLAAVAVFLLYRAFAPAPAPARSAQPAAAKNSPFAAIDSAAAAKTRGAAGSRRRAGAVLPTPTGQPLDPKLRLDLLAKVQSISYQGSERNIFQYYTPPPPIPKPVANPITGPGGAGAKAPGGPPAPPPPPPIPLKYYGYVEKPMGTAKKGFFSDGDDIFIAGEGEIVNKKYRIVKIGVNTVEAEDIKTNHRQVLPLQEQP